MVYMYAILGLTTLLTVNEMYEITSDISDKIREKKDIIRTKQIKEDLKQQIVAIKDNVKNVEDKEMNLATLMTDYGMQADMLVIDEEQKEKVIKVRNATKKAIKNKDFLISDNCNTLKEKTYLPKTFKCEEMDEQNMYYIEGEVLVNTSDKTLNTKMNNEAIMKVLEKLIQKRIKEEKRKNQMEVKYKKEEYKNKIENSIEMTNIEEKTYLENVEKTYSEIEIEVLNKVNRCEDIYELPNYICEDSILKEKIEKRIN